MRPKQERQWQLIIIFIYQLIKLKNYFVGVICGENYFNLERFPEIL